MKTVSSIFSETTNEDDGRSKIGKNSLEPSAHVHELKWYNNILVSTNQYLKTIYIVFVLIKPQATCKDLENTCGKEYNISLL